MLLHLNQASLPIASVYRTEGDKAGERDKYQRRRAVLLPFMRRQVVFLGAFENFAALFVTFNALCLCWRIYTDIKLQISSPLAVGHNYMVIRCNWLSLVMRRKTVWELEERRSHTFLRSLIISMTSFDAYRILEYLPWSYLIFLV